MYVENMNMDDEDDGKVGSSQCVPSDVGDGQTVLMVAAALHWTLMISHPLHTRPLWSASSSASLSTSSSTSPSSYPCPPPFPPLPLPPPRPDLTLMI